MKDNALFTKDYLLDILSLSPSATGIYSGTDIIIQAANDAMLVFWGKDRSIIGLPMADGVPELKGQPFLDILKGVILTGESYEARDAEAFLSVDGKLQKFYFDFSYQAVRNPEDGSFSVLHTATDVTERHLSMGAIDKLNEDLTILNQELTGANKQLNVSNVKLEMAQREAEVQRAILYDFFMQAPAGICVLDGPEFVFELINPGYQKLLPNRQLIGRPIFEALPELLGQPVQDALEQVYRTGENKTMTELSIPVAEFEGGPHVDRYFTFNYLARKNGEGKTNGVLVFVYEVSDQVVARKRLEESERHFRHLADLVPAKISNALPTGEVTFFNKQWLDYSGLSFEALRDFGYQRMMHPEEITDFQAGLASAAATGIPFEKEMRFKDKSGAYRWHLNIASPILDERGAVKMWVGSTTDIQKIKEEEQRKLDFVSLLSHELKTPITSIKGYVQLILNMMDSDKGELYPNMFKISLDRIDKLVLKLTNMIAEMLDLNRIETDKLGLNRKLTSLNELLSIVVEEFRFINQDHTINLYEEFRCYVNVDRDKIEQVLINLMSNAIKYAPDSNQVDVRIFQTADGRAGISVRDYGIGIEKTEHQRVFQRFYRVEGLSAHQISGFGIGLFIAHSIIEKHEGSITIDSEKGNGAVFTIMLPVVS